MVYYKDWLATNLQCQGSMKRAFRESKRREESTTTRRNDNRLDTNVPAGRSGPVASLHQAESNQVVQEALENGEIQSKLEASQSKDKYEPAAEWAGEKALRRAEAKPTAEHDRKLQRKPTTDKSRETDRGTDARQFPISSAELCPHCIQRYRSGKPLNCDDCEKSLVDTDKEETVPISVDTGAILPKFEISRPDERSEREADRVADRIVNTSPPESRPIPLDGIQPETHDGGGLTVGDGTERQIESLRRGGRPLPPSVRSFFEPRFGLDFGDVRIHSGPRANEVAQSIGAKAFTFGTNIAFAEGEYDPESTEGTKLLAHELTHVVQQSDTSDSADSVQRQSTIRQPGKSPESQHYDVYEVQSGDTLSDIAQMYEHVEDYDELYDYSDNSNRLESPHLIYPGDKVKIPPKSSTEGGGVPSPWWCPRRDPDEYDWDKERGIDLIHTDKISGRINQHLRQKINLEGVVDSWVLYGFQIESAIAAGGLSELNRLSDHLRTEKPETDLPSAPSERKIHIFGFTDCPGSRYLNALLRVNRAVNVYNLLAPLPRSKDPTKNAKPGSIGAYQVRRYIVDNNSKEKREINRGVVIIDHYVPQGRGMPYSEEVVRQACDEFNQSKYTKICESFFNRPKDDSWWNMLTELDAIRFIDGPANGWDPSKFEGWTNGREILKNHFLAGAENTGEVRRSINSFMDSKVDPRSLTRGIQRLRESSGGVESNVVFKSEKLLEYIQDEMANDPDSIYKLYYDYDYLEWD